MEPILLLLISFSCYCFLNKPIVSRSNPQRFKALVLRYPLAKSIAFASSVTFPQEIACLPFEALVPRINILPWQVRWLSRITIGYSLMIVLGFVFRLYLVDDILLSLAPMLIHFILSPMSRIRLTDGAKCGTGLGLCGNSPEWFTYGSLIILHGSGAPSH